MINLVIGLVLILVIFFNLKYTENFIDLQKKNKLKYNVKDIPYSNFLVDLNSNFKDELNSVQPKEHSSFQKVLCDNNLKIEVQNKSLNKSFNKISSSLDNLLVFDRSINRNNKDRDAYIKKIQPTNHVSYEHRLSDCIYFNKIDHTLNIQNNTEIIQDMNFQDDPDFNYTIEKDNLDPCLYKANKLSQYTDPRLYLSSNKIYFPPRFMKDSPYKNTQLPKSTNLKLWTDMYNCCSSNI